MRMFFYYVSELAINAPDNDGIPCSVLYSGLL